MKLSNKLLAICCCLFASFTYAEDERPNIVVIMSDDAGYTDLGSFGGEIDTPNLDALAKSGLRLSSFYSNARCSPTRASLLTGVDAAHVGFGGGVVGDWVRELPFPAHRARLTYSQPTIAELLADNNYQTMMVGKWHLGGSYVKDGSESMRQLWRDTHPESMVLTEQEMQLDYLALPPQRGFQKSFVFHAAQGNLFFKPGEPQPYYEDNNKAKLAYDSSYNMHCYTDNAFSKKHYSACHGDSGKAFYATDGITDRALNMIDSATEKSDPFFLYVAYRAPHLPLQAPEELVQKYLKKYENLQQVMEDRHVNLVKQGLFPKDAKTRGTNHLWANKSGEELEQVRMRAAVHAAMMEKIDENIGKIVHSLKKRNEYENTIIVYVSDNGAAAHIGDLMNSPYHGVKALVWEGGARTHGIINWPKTIEPNTISKDVVWVGDLMPTFLEVSKTKFPETFRGEKIRSLDGRSILPILKGERLAPPKALFINDKGQQSVLYEGRWKLMIEPGWYLQTLAKPGLTYELYDLINDPGEVNNLIDAHPDLVKKLLVMVNDWKQENKIVEYHNIIKIKPKDPY